MAFSIASTAKVVATSSVTTKTITVPAGVQAGDTIFLLGSSNSGANPLTLTDGSYTLLGSHAFPGHVSALWYKQNAQTADAGTVLTVTRPAAGRYSLFLIVVRGLNTSGVIDGHSDFISATGEGGTAQPGPTKTGNTFVTTAADATFQFVAETGGASTNGTTGITSITDSSGGSTLAVDGYDTLTAGPASGAIFYAAGPSGIGTSIGGDTFTSDGTAGTGNWSIYTVGTVLAVSGGQDTVRPTSLISNAGAWTNQGGAASIPAALADETDTTFAQSPVVTAGPYTFEVGIGELNTGIPSVSYRAFLSAAGSQTVTVKLKQGATVIATWSDTVTSTSPVDFAHTCTSGQAAAITDYSALSVDFEAS